MKYEATFIFPVKRVTRMFINAAPDKELKAGTIRPLERLVSFPTCTRPREGQDPWKTMNEDFKDMVHFSSVA